MKIIPNRKISFNKIVILICILIFFIYNYILQITGDRYSTMILLGVDYKTFTLGFGEYYRLITSGFCHFSFLHLLGNMISLLSLGNFIENVYGSKKYLMYLFGGIIMGSLTSGILNTNIIESGISAALYTFLVIVFLYFFIYHRGLSYNFISIIFINLGLNFIPNVSWQAHLGGAIAGFIFFFIDYYQRAQNKINNLIFKLLLVFTIVFLSFKYYSTKDKISGYSEINYRYVEFTKVHVPALYERYKNKIYN